MHLIARGCHHWNVWSWSWVPGYKTSSEANAALHSTPCLTSYLVFFRQIFFFLQWAAEYYSIPHNLFYCSLSKLTSVFTTNCSKIRVCNKYLWIIDTRFSMGFQWSQVFTSESFGAFQYAEAVRFLFFSKHLSSKEDSEIFTLAF